MLNGITSNKPITKMEVNEFFKLIDTNYEDGMDLKVINVGNPNKSRYNTSDTNKHYFYLDVEFTHDGVTNKTGLTYNLGEPLDASCNTFNIKPGAKLFELIIGLDESVNPNNDINIEFDKFKLSMEDIEFRAKVDKYRDTSGNMQYLLIPV